MHIKPTKCQESELENFLEGYTVTFDIFFAIKGVIPYKEFMFSWRVCKRDLCVPEQQNQTLILEVSIVI